MGLGHCGLGRALMPNENLSGEWIPEAGQGKQGGTRRQCSDVSRKNELPR